MGSEILRCAQDDNPELASFDSQIVLFEMYWGSPLPYGLAPTLGWCRATAH